MSNANDNHYKRIAREFIAAKVNNHFYDKRRLKFLELYGSGIGAKYYCTAIDKISKMFIVNLCQEDIRKPHRKVARMVYGNLYNLLDKPYVNFSGSKFDVLNYDFCTYYSLGNIQAPTIENILKKTVNSEICEKNGLLFLTIMVDGFQIDMQKNKKDILTKPRDIIDSILQLSYKSNVHLEYSGEYQLYRSTSSCRGSVLMNTSFIMR